MQNNPLSKVNLSLVHFLLLTIFAAATTMFLVAKAQEAAIEIQALSENYYSP